MQKTKEQKRRSEAAKKGAMTKLAKTYLAKKVELDFGGTLLMLKAGQKATRKGWNGKGQYIALQVPDANSANTLPYIYIITVDGKRVPWLASQTDMLAEDWILIA